jgi:hypothetical protein
MSESESESAPQPTWGPPSGQPAHGAQTPDAPHAARREPPTADEVIPPEPLPESEPPAPTLYDAMAEESAVPVAAPPAEAAAEGKRRWPGSAKAVVAVLVVTLLGAAGGLGYAWYKTNQDKQDAQKTASTNEATLNKQVSDLQTQVNSLTKQVNDLNTQLKSAQDDAAAAKKSADDANAQLSSIKGLFPLDASKSATGLPGTYTTGTLNTATGQCNLASCPAPKFTLVIAGSGSYTVSDPQLGQPTLSLAANQVWTANGLTADGLQLTCENAPQITSFTLDLIPSQTALASNGALQVTALRGHLVLTSPAATGASGAACPAGLAVYDVAATRS